MTATFRRLGQSELLPRYIFAESLYARRRVLEVGAVASTLGQSARFLATRGARLVVACDDDLDAVEDAQRRLGSDTVRFRANLFDDLEGGSFDLVIVSDLAAYVRAPELLRALVRLLPRTGLLMGGLRNPAGLALAQVIDPETTEAPPTYGQLLDTLTPHFSAIEVATQSPVLGYQLAFERSEGLQVDGSLAGTSEAAYFVVVAGNEPIRAFDPTWVQLPPEPLAFTGGRLEEYTQRARNWQERSGRLKDALGKAREEVTSKDDEVQQLRQALEEAQETSARYSAQLEAIRSHPEEERERDTLAAKLRRGEAELEVVRQRAEDAESRLTRLQVKVEGQDRSSREVHAGALAAAEAVRLERARKDELATQLEDARSRLASAYEEIGSIRDQTAEARVELERTRLLLDRATHDADEHQRQHRAARQREVRIAEQHTEALTAIENLQSELGPAKAAAHAASVALLAREAELVKALRAGEADAVDLRRTRKERDLEAARVVSLQAELEGLLPERAALQTEVAQARSELARLSSERETEASGHRSARALAASLEQQSAEAKLELEALSARGEAEAEARIELEAALLRSNEEREQHFARNSALMTARAESESAARAQGARIVELEAQVETGQRALSSLQQLSDLVAERARDREDQVGALAAQVRELEELLTEAGREQAEQELAIRAQQVEAILAVKAAELQSRALAAELVAAKAHSVEREALLEQRSSAAVRADSARAELEALLEQERGARAQADAATVALAARLHELQGALSAAEATVAAGDAELQRQSAALALAAAGREGLEEALRERGASLAGAEASRAELATQLLERTSSLTAAEARLQELTETVHAAQSHEADAGQRFAALETDLGEAARAFGEKEAAFQSTEVELRRALAEAMSARLTAETEATERLAEAGARLAGLEAGHSETSGRLATLQAALSAATGERDTAVTAASTLRQQQEELESALALAHEKLAHAENDRVQLQASLDEVQVSRLELQHSTEADAALRASQVAEGEAREALVRLRSEETAVQLAATVARQSELSRELDLTREAARAAAEHSELLRKELGTALAERRSLGVQVEESQRAREAVDARSAQGAKEISERVAALELTLEQRQAENEQLGQQAQVTQQRLDEALGEIETLRESRTQLTSELDGMIESLERAQAVALEAQQSRTELESALHQTRGELTEVAQVVGATDEQRRLLEAARADVRGYAERQRALEAQLAQSQKQLALMPELQEQADTLGVEKQILDDDRVRLVDQIEKFEAERSGFLQELELLKSEVRRLRTEAGNRTLVLEDEHARLRSKVDKLATEKSALEVKLAQAANELRLGKGAPSQKQASLPRSPPVRDEFELDVEELSDAEPFEDDDMVEGSILTDVELPEDPKPPRKP